ncbi:hypothetical protein CEXT_119211 [Caerostris extrusa]|uniref:Uncharacterized protein n=1 Tax=Caerostris extrusa TaxID=172846 RepID=A0AAV4TQ83_CAEEX|nr:hypothetical protein CEXT_119211 [Caerostris extrusa]
MLWKSLHFNVVEIITSILKLFLQRFLPLKEKWRFPSVLIVASMDTLPVLNIKYYTSILILLLLDLLTLTLIGLNTESETRVPNGTRKIRSPSLRRGSESLERRALKIDKFSRVVFPLLFIVLNIAYWCYYLT